MRKPTKMQRWLATEWQRWAAIWHEQALVAQYKGDATGFKWCAEQRAEHARRAREIMRIE